ncbi:hypothetical protein TNCT_676401 [Trichonephila clavata]|uniref:Uncharacterized protein n=1 Tax=Trichonephila clavata TaxID=2740835 RepID=A0A8X6LGZ5_TRICU|nr:hypothetical protein TNCT_676401 [Trichonephila clavata]
MIDLLPRLGVHYFHISRHTIHKSVDKLSKFFEPSVHSTQTKPTFHLQFTAKVYSFCPTVAMSRNTFLTDMEQVFCWREESKKEPAHMFHLGNALCVDYVWKLLRFLFSLQGFAL